MHDDVVPGHAKLLLDGVPELDDLAVLKDGDCDLLGQERAVVGLVDDGDDNLLAGGESDKRFE